MLLFGWLEGHPACEKRCSNNFQKFTLVTPPNLEKLGRNWQVKEKVVIYGWFIFIPVFYLRQVNGVNGGDTVFVRCVCLSVCAQLTGQSDQFKTVKATDFKFDVLVAMDSLDMNP